MTGDRAYRAEIAPVPDGVPRPVWSVMIPTYNAGDYLAQCLRSVLAQDPGPQAMQIEVVDDHSTVGDAQALVRELGDGRVELFRQPVNRGLIGNLATCIQRARGEIVHLLHDDDFVYNGFYEHLERGFASSAAVGAACCRHIYVEPDGNWLSISPLEARRPGVIEDWLVRIASRQRLVTPAVVVKREVYEHLGAFDSRMTWAGEDWEMWVRIAASHTIWYEPAPLAAYRTRPDSNTGRHFRLAGELGYNRKAITMFGSYLPADRAPSIMRTARRTYARTALSNARDFAREGDAQAVRAHLRAALRFSRSPRVLLQAARLLAGSARP